MDFFEFGYGGFYIGTADHGNGDGEDELPVHYIGGTIFYMSTGLLGYYFEPGDANKIAVSNGNTYDCHSIDQVSERFIAGVVMLTICSCYMFLYIKLCCNARRRRKEYARVHMHRQSSYRIVSSTDQQIS